MYVGENPREVKADGLIVTRSIVGLKKEESEALLAFLFNHIGRGVDYQARVRWAPKTVVAWDVSINISCVISEYTDEMIEPCDSSFCNDGLEDRRTSSLGENYPSSRCTI
jgi:taurine dioxygenase/sulfonate dioxygenase